MRDNCEGTSRDGGGDRPDLGGNISGLADGIRDRLSREPNRGTVKVGPSSGVNQPPNPEMVAKVARMIRDTPALALAHEPDELDLTRVALAPFLNDGYSVPGRKSDRRPDGWPDNGDNGGKPVEGKPKKKDNSTTLLFKDGRLTALRCYDQSEWDEVGQSEIDEFAKLCSKHDVSKMVVATDGAFGDDARRAQSARASRRGSGGGASDDGDDPGPELWDWPKIIKKLREQKLDKILARAGVRAHVD